jgi:hypothetical protein
MVREGRSGAAWKTEEIMSRILIARRAWCRSTAVLIALVLSGAAARADLRFTEPVVNAGEVRTGSALSHRFAFANHGSAPATITEVRTSCGCMKPHLEPDGTELPHSFQPGEEGALMLEVNTLGLTPGNHTWRLTVCYDSGKRSYEVQLQMTGWAVTEVTVQPSSLTIIMDNAVSHEVVLTDVRQRGLSVSEVRTTSPEVKGRLTEQFQDEHGQWVRKIALEVGADYPEGRHNEMLDILTDDPVYRDLRVPLTVVKRPRQRFTAEPGAVTLFAAAGHEVPSRIVRVRDSEDQPVIIEQIVADDAAITCRWAQGPNNLATIRVLVDRARLKGGSLKSQIHVQIGNPVRETLVIPVTCAVE